LTCPNCGSSIVEKGKFCPFCGTTIPEDLLIKIETKQELIDHGRIAEAEAQKKHEEEKTERSKTIVCVIGTIVISLAIIIYLILRPH